MSNIVFHGTSAKIQGKVLFPKQPSDSFNKKENLLFGIYATDIKEVAIARAIANLNVKGVQSCGLGYKGPVYALIYEGRPEQDYAFVYHLPGDSFQPNGWEGHQLISTQPVEYIIEEKILIKDYFHLIRKAKKENGKLIIL